MKVPEGLTEQQVLSTIDIVATRLANKFKFGYHGTDDMKQQAKLMALEILNKDAWDGIRPFENFLYSCVHNKLYNFKRDNYERPDKPCLTCPLYNSALESQCEQFTNKNDCQLYTSWLARNSSKKNIMKPTDIYNIHDEKEDNMKMPDHIEAIEKKEVWGLIDKHLDIKYRADYLKIKNNIKIPKQRRIEIEQEIIKIIQRFYNHANN